LPRESEFRDYLYVSARKVVRMSRTLRTPVWKRVRNLQVNLGPVGAGLSLDLDSRADEVIALVPEVEQAIDEHFGIRYVTDPELEVGQWFLIETTPMAYTVGDDEDRHSVLFLGFAGTTRFFLGGSAEYLLDRPAAAENSTFKTYASSSFNGIHGFLTRLAHYDEFRSDREEADFNEQRPIEWDKPGSYLNGMVESAMSVSHGRLEPMTTLARCLDIEIDQLDNITVIGTPLYVAFDAPE
jgi:hypothetical protein